MDIEEKKSLTSSWFRELRDMFCEEFIDIDGGSFERKNWDHKFEGGGEMSLMKGEVFEKVGVNISTVSGKFDNDFKSEVKGTEEAPNYWASGISLVAHMQSPKVPAFHFNTGGIDINIASELPPVFIPKAVPLSQSRLNST